MPGDGAGDGDGHPMEVLVPLQRRLQGDCGAEVA